MIMVLFPLRLTIELHSNVAKVAYYTILFPEDQEDILGRKILHKILKILQFLNSQVPNGYLLTIDVRVSLMLLRDWRIHKDGYMYFYFDTV